MSIIEALDAARAALTGDNLVSAALSTAISPEGKQLVVSLLAGVEQLEAKHEADKAAAVEQAKAEAVASLPVQPAEPGQEG